ncbi:MAG: hypothetical protein DRG82_13710 [Deltaproteobacteria bacterium]|nr:MAG: hypothetical protein DRG82_13710 [Deltaproteobacteria bacterium]
MAVSWLFPGKLVQIDTPCLDCGEPIHVEMRDGELLRCNPASVIGYVAVPLAKWGQDVAYA